MFGDEEQKKKYLPKVFLFCNIIVSVVITCFFPEGIGGEIARPWQILVASKKKTIYFEKTTHSSQIIDWYRKADILQ